jgi:hypothetical protein
MFLAWTIEIAKTLAYALATSLIFVFIRTTLPYLPHQKAVGLAVFRAAGYPLMLVGFFTIVLGVLLARVDLIGDGGRIHFTLR